MNKFAKAGIAGFAALALAASGGTYALWSDYVVDGGNAVGADQLKITIAGVSSGSNQFQFDKLNMAPGEKFDQENVITGRVGGSDIQTAKAYATFKDLTDADNGCGSQTEEDVDTCKNPGDPGEFSEQATVVVNRYNADCSTGLLSLVTAGSNTTLKSLAGQKKLIGDMTNGQQYCLKMTIGLPEDATNKVQTDSSGFNIRYDLEQVPNS